MKTPDSHDAFESALRRDAARARQDATPSPDLPQRITRAVHQSRAETAAAAPRSTWRRPVLSFVGAAVCALVAVALWSPPSPTPEPAISPAVAAADFSRLTPAALGLWSTIEPEAQALLAQDPLQSEVDALVTDARAAVHFLALNFLPESVANKPRSG